METTERGHVKVNERLQTTAGGVWAVGDCAGSPHFTHISEDDFAVVSENIAGGDGVTTGRRVPLSTRKATASLASPCLALVPEKS